MVEIISLNFWIYFLYFIAAVFIAFYIPGSVLLKRTGFGMRSLHQITLSIIVGLSLWAVQGFILGFLSLRFLTYGYVFVFLILYVFQLRSQLPSFRKPKLKITKYILLVFCLVLVGSFGQISRVFMTGVNVAGDFYQCCGDSSDNFWFLNLSKQLVTSIPPFEPGMDGVIVHNYHYFSNIVVAELVRVFHLPLVNTQFQYSYIFLSILLGLSVVAYGSTIGLGRKFVVWFLFFIYFGGDLIWLLLLVLRNGTPIFSMSSLEDGSKFLLNLPRSFAIVIFFGSLSMLYRWQTQKKSFASTILLGLVIASLAGFKVYLGIFALTGLLFLAAFSILKKDWYPVLLFLVSLVGTFIMYFPVNSGAGGMYFTGFWFYENFIVQPGLKLDRLELARRVYLEHDNWIRVGMYHAFYLFLGTFALLGTKLIGIFQTRSMLKSIPFTHHIFLISGIFVSFIAGSFFQQESGGGNTFNFIVNVFVIGSIYSAITISFLMNRYRRFGLFVALLVIALTIPRILYETVTNISRNMQLEGSRINSEEIRAFEYFAALPKGVVVVDHRYFGLDRLSPYVNYFTDQPMYLSGIQILESHGVDTDVRKQIVLELFTSKDSQWVSKTLHDEDIRYIISSKQTLIPAFEILDIERVKFQSENIIIWEIDKSRIEKYRNSSQ